jgi:hypothetical protein
MIEQLQGVLPIATGSYLIAPQYSDPHISSLHFPSPHSTTSPLPAYNPEALNPASNPYRAASEAQLPADCVHASEQLAALVYWSPFAYAKRWATYTQQLAVYEAKTKEMAKGTSSGRLAPPLVVDGIPCLVLESGAFVNPSVKRLEMLSAAEVQNLCGDGKNVAANSGGGAAHGLERMRAVAMRIAPEHVQSGLALPPNKEQPKPVARPACLVTLQLQTPAYVQLYNSARKTGGRFVLMSKSSSQCCLTVVEESAV